MDIEIGDKVAFLIDGQKTFGVVRKIHSGGRDSNFQGGPLLTVAVVGGGNRFVSMPAVLDRMPARDVS
jgi:hypothetical protein